jgi:hypothetical protein
MTIMMKMIILMLFNSIDCNKIVDRTILSTHVYIFIHKHNKYKHKHIYKNLDLV